ncbi:hypothetical protein L7E55_02055 [Pelotomaculum isophthalicicum JI]|uniref:Uncharacterized protein n=1 Tax=Pelotomaculum isophthalicicum JI TaxID=947010 RepID=A0A9X4JSQ8_9FIRM|nr:hypothetical protein [Pelotomaculum isophthalicicum]MDF9407149.1 hypothetical protein [Pelotomaculum isophthalicicum JI]
MNTPLLLVQIPPKDNQQSQATSAIIETEIIAIAVYGKDIGVPLAVSIQRVFDAEKPFRFPTEITQGVTKTRIVYRYTLAQWHELLEVTTLPTTPAALKQLMIPMLLYMKQNFPDIFNDIEYDREFGPEQYAELIPME